VGGWVVDPDPDSDSGYIHSPPVATGLPLVHRPSIVSRQVRLEPLPLPTPLSARVHTQLSIVSVSVSVSGP